MPGSQDRGASPSTGRISSAMPATTPSGRSSSRPEPSPPSPARAVGIEASTATPTGRAWPPALPDPSASPSTARATCTSPTAATTPSEGGGRNPIVTTIAGGPAPIGSTDGTGANARITRPTGIAGDGAGNLYVTDWNATVRKVVIATKAVTTFAGAATQQATVDGTLLDARFTSLNALHGDGLGSLYVADATTIRKVTLATGAVVSLAGTPNAPGYMDAARARPHTSPVRPASPATARATSTSPTPAWIRAIASGRSSSPPALSPHSRAVRTT